MKKATNIHSTILSLCLILSLGIHAETPKINLNISTAGSLSDLLGNNASHVKELTLSGYLNGSDIFTIRNMDSLTILNLANSSIVSGGSAYYNDGTYNYYTNDNKLGNWMFYKCSNLLSLVLPDNLVIIGQYAFGDCSGLSTIALPNKLITLEPFAFSGLRNLKSISIPSSVTSIGFPLIFWGTDSITQINVENQNPNYCSLDGVLFNKDTTALLTCPTGRNSGYTIPDGIKSIGDYAFANCYGLSSITIPNSVTSIGIETFIFCKSLTSIKLPENITTIGNDAFDLYFLVELNCQMKNPPIITIQYNPIEKFKTMLYVPEGSYSAYHSANYWGNFTTVVEYDPTLINSLHLSQIKVFSKEDVLIVDGVENGDEVSVYTLAGVFLQCKKATNAMVKFNLKNKDLYIIRTPHKTIKAAHLRN